MQNKKSRPICTGYPDEPHPARAMNNDGYHRVFKSRTSRRVKRYACYECGRTTIKPAPEVT